MSNSVRLVLARIYAVGGALAFVLALGSLVALDRGLARAAGTPAQVIDLLDLGIDAGLFTLFALHHSLMARTGVKQWLTRYVPPPLERSTYVWIASALAVLVYAGWRPMPVVLYQLGAPWTWLLAAARIAGAVMTLEAASRIDPRDLAGLRQAWTYRPGADGSGFTARPSSDGAPEPKAGPLVSRGGYRLVRHPLYLGWILMVWSVPVMTVGRLVFAAISTLYLLVAIPLEERSLREKYGHSYRAYQATVRWRVLPGLY